MSERPTMKFTYLQGVWVGVHRAEAPTNEEWTSHCVHVERVRDGTRGVLVYTEGGGPSTRQRLELREALDGRPAPPTAIMTASPLVRGIITSLNWFLRGRIAAFPPVDLEGALSHVGCEASPRREPIVRALSDLSEELGVRPPPGVG